jgi:capsule polysaccharide export protein KpsE/RkpR
MVDIHIDEMISDTVNKLKKVIEDKGLETFEIISWHIDIENFIDLYENKLGIKYRIES